MNFTTPAELKYDDGSSFYSPGSYHRLIRSSVTDKLYWLGNISATPPEGGNPRYPLVIAEVDEAGATPALKKNTVTVIDTRQPGEPELVQYTNFTLLENRETLNFDLYQTKWTPNTGYGATYKYVLLSNDILRGDFDGDGNVTTADYYIMRANWLSTGNAFNTNGEVTGDGIVDIFDFKEFKENLFPGPASALASTVPEPSTIVLLLAAAPTWLLLRSRGRKKRKAL